MVCSAARKKKTFQRCARYSKANNVKWVFNVCFPFINSVVLGCVFIKRNIELDLQKAILHPSYYSADKNNLCAEKVDSWTSSFCSDFYTTWDISHNNCVHTDCRIWNMWPKCPVTCMVLITVIAKQNNANSGVSDTIMHIPDTKQVQWQSLVSVHTAISLCLVNILPSQYMCCQYPVSVYCHFIMLCNYSNTARTWS